MNMHGGYFYRPNANVHKCQAKKFKNILCIYHFLVCLYYVGIVPFKPMWKGEIVHLYRNIFQEIICIFIYFGAMIWTFVKLYSLYPKRGFYASPSTILSLVGVIFQMLYVFSFVYKFGVKVNDVQILLNSGSKYRSSSSKYKDKLKVVLTPLLFIFITMFAIYWQAVGTMERYFPEGCRLLILIPNILGGSTRKDYNSHCPTPQTLQSILTLAAMVCGELIYNGLEMLVFALAITGYTAAKKAAEETKQSRQLVSKTSADDIEYHLQTLHSLHEHFEGLNRVGNCFFLLALCLLVPWTSFRLTDSFPGGKEQVTTDDVVKVYNWTVFIFYATTMYFAAETQRQVQQFRSNLTILILRNDINHYWKFPAFSQSSNMALCKYVKHTLKDICFHGGPFFHFSYKFLGTTIGIVITLVLFELQFGKNAHTKFAHT